MANEALAQAQTAKPEVGNVLRRFAQTLAKFAEGSGEHANLLKALAGKIDAEAHADDGSRLGDGNGEVSRAEVVQFISTCAARADQASRGGNAQEANNQRTLMELGKALLKMVP
jgi:hypothetical protein